MELNTEKMNILVVTHYFYPEQFKINDLVEELQKKGHCVTVLTGLPNYPQGSFFEGYSYLKGPYRETYKNVTVIRLPIFLRGKGISLKLVLNYLSFPIVASLFLPFLLKLKIDKVFIYQLSPFFSAIPAIFFSKIKKVPAIIWVTDLWPESLSATGIVKSQFWLDIVEKIVVWVYENCTLILTTSKGFIHHINGQGIKANKIKFVPQWAEPFFEQANSVHSETKDDRVSEDTFNVMFAGNIGSAQDMPTLLEAASLLRDNDDIMFYFLGDGNSRKWAEETARERNLKNIHFLGKQPIETMPYYYSRASVMLVSLVNTKIFSITIPTKVQSYLASGKPIVASLSGEGGEVITNSNSGISVASSSPLELAEAIKKLAKLSKVDLQVLGSNGKQFYKQEFLREKMIKRIENYLASATY